MSTNIKTIVTLREELENRLVKLRETTKCDLVTFYLYDSEHEQVYLPVGLGLIEPNSFYRGVPSMERVVGKVVRRRKPIIANDAEHHPDMTGPFTHIEKNKSAAGFPIKNLKEEILGVVFVSYREVHRFEDNQIKQIEDWVNEAAAFIEQVFKSADGKNLKFTLRREAGHRRETVKLQDILNRLQDVLRNVDIALLLPKRGEQKLAISAGTGINNELIKEIEIEISPDSNNVISSVFINGNQQTVEDFQQNPDLLFNIDVKTPWEKVQLFPIVSEYHSLGVLSVFRRDPFGFTHQDLDAITAFTSLLAVTIENEERIIALNALHDLGVRLTLSLNLKDVLDEVVRSTCQIIGADVATLHLYDPIKEQFHELEYAAVYPENARKHMEKPQSGDGLTKEILRKRRIFVENTEKETDVLAVNTFIKKEGIKAYVGTPLVSNGDALGVLYVSFRHPRRFSPDELSMIQIMANHASTAVHRAQFADQQIAVAEIARNIASNLDIDLILQTILEKSLELLHCQEGSIALYDAATEELEFRYAIGKQNWRRIKPEQGLTGAAAFTRKPVRIGDVTKDERYLAHVKGTQSELDIPLLVGDELVGVLNIESSRLNAFSAEDENLAMTLASQAAIAIVNARLLKDANTRAEALKGLHDVASELVTITDAPKGLDKILNQIVEKAQTVLGADLVDIYQYLQMVDEFPLPPARAGIRYEPEVIKDKIYKDDVLYAIVGGRIPLYAVNVQEQSNLTRRFSVERANIPRERFVLREKIKSSASIPMIVNYEVVGVLFVNFREPQTFSQLQKELIELFANQAATAIRNARLYEKVQQRLDERLSDIETFREIYEKMHEGELSDVLNLIAEKALELTGAKYGGVWLLNKTHTSLTFGGLAGGAVTDELPDLPVDEKSENSINKQVVLSGETYLCKNVKEDKFYKEWYDDSCSEIAVPLKYQGRVIGTLNVESTLVNGFTEDHRKLLEALAGQAAIVVQNHRLVERLEILDRMGRELTSGIRLHEDEILELIYQRASQLMDTGNMYIALYDDVTEMIGFPLMYVAGIKKEQPARKFGEEGMGKTEWIIQNKEPILHATKTEGTEWYAQPGHQDFLETPLGSWIGVPMQVGEKVLGVIATYHPNKENLYGRDELDVLSAMARQAAIAIDNARLYYDVNHSLEESNQRLKALVDFGEQVTSDINLTEKEIIDLIYQQASQLMDTGNMYIALYDDVTKMISFPLMYVDEKKKEQPARKFGEKGIGKTEAIIQNNEPIFHATKTEGSAWYAQPGHQDFAGDEMSSWIGVPMQVGGKILGVVSTYHPTEDYWYTKNDLTILEGIARVAAIALENMHLYEEARGEVIAAKQLSTLGTAIAALQHRINNTFNIIIPNVDRLRKRVDLSDPTIIEILDIIERNARYTSAIITRIQEPLKEVEISDININAILEEIASRKRDLWKTGLTTPLVDVEFKPDESIPLFRGSSGQIAEVFDNLTDNAYKAMPKGGEIRIVSDFSNDVIMIKVIDSGIGIPEDIQDRLFKKPVPSRNPGGGSGLGLWLSLLMLQSIGGDITVESSGESGTTMCVTIPANQGRKEVVK